MSTTKLSTGRQGQFVRMGLIQSGTSSRALRRLAKKLARTSVLAECVNCKHQRVILPHEVAADDMPICDKCGSPMIAKKAQG